MDILLECSNLALFNLNKDKGMKLSYTSILLIITFLFASLSKTFAQEDRAIAETVVHLLSYVSMDYPEAVENGEIVDQEEFEEQQEFTGEAYALTKESAFLSGKEKENILSQIEDLIKSVDNKKPASEISQRSNLITSEIIKLTGIETAPKSWPSHSNGKVLYDLNCASCHGDSGRGDGPAGIGLEPLPSDFHDADLMENFSVYQAYNSIRFGLMGTGMRAFSELSEVEIWDLAFYVKALREQEEGLDTIELRKEFDGIINEIGLENVAKLTDKELLEEIRRVSNNNAEKKLKALRLLEPSESDLANSLKVAKDYLQKTLDSYAAGEKKLARTQAITAYLEGIEPVEARLRSIDASFVRELEAQMFAVRKAIEKNESIEVLREKVESANAYIEEADQMLSAQNLNFWVAFLLSLSIVLREALEAFLILAVVIALIRSANVKRALVWVHGGWISAVLLGLAGWFLSDYIIQFGGKNREIMEGLVSLIAVAILVSAGFWLHNKTYAKKWAEFVEVKIGKYLKGERMFGLAAFCFMIVFREAFEVILFLQAIKLEAGTENKSAIGFGALAAFAAIGVIAYVFLKYTKKLPIQFIFKYSSYLVILLALILMGRGVHSLQESGWISVTQLPSMFRIDWLGVYPTLQTILAQLGLLAVIILTYYINKMRLQRAEN